MTEIDFLPKEYREQHTQRKNQAWRVVVVVAFAALCAAGMVAQRAHRGRLESKLASTRTQYDQALQRMEQLQKLDSELTALRAEASLINYLRRPWPRTRILCAVLEPVPESVLLTEVQIHHAAGERSGFVRERTAPRSRGGNEEGPLPHPALADLEQFRRESDVQRCVVSISGWADEHFHLHDYLDQISHRDLVQRVELLDVETSDLGQENNERVRFSARVTVAPAYGQPGGPQVDEPATKTASQWGATGLPVLVACPALHDPSMTRFLLERWSEASRGIGICTAMNDASDDSTASYAQKKHWQASGTRADVGSLPGSRLGLLGRSPS